MFATFHDDTVPAYSNEFIRTGADLATPLVWFRCWILPICADDMPVPGSAVDRD